MSTGTPAAPPATTASPPVSAHAQEGEAKAVAKSAADHAVANDPNAVHAVNLTVKNPKVWASAGTGAAIGAAVAGPPGALVGGVAGLVVEKYQIAHGPVGKAYDWVKGKLTHKKA